ncbi:lysozyme [Saccharopolyspora griseoalba]|uniref:Lysozyme n=1 Tax=Saccharopolyspora griseoalba TaxID=1431848 RepID=A0ABW2LGB2_9PSEU
MFRSVAPPRPVRTRRMPAVLAAALAAVLAAAAPATAAAPEPEQTERSAPRLDPAAPHGAWAGYSTGKSATQSRIPAQIPAGSVAGTDVSGHQGEVDWPAAVAAGARFAYVKATEGSGFRSDSYRSQYDGALAAGLVRGAYHFALPDRSSGAQQANFFVDNGGMWAPDGRTLPGVLDIEHNPYGETCYGLDPAAMSGWLADFSNTYHARTGRFPAIYTTASWWNTCTGGNPDFAANNPLWVARYAPEIGELPAGWNFHSFWQHNDTGPLPGGQDVFNGDLAQLGQFAG